MEPSVIVSLISGGGVIIAAFLAFLGSKKGSLATAESEFRKTILQENKDLRDRVDKLEKELAAERQARRAQELAQLRPITIENTVAVEATAPPGGAV